MKSGVQIICLSDIHGKLNAVRDFVNGIDSLELRETDAIVIAGDIGDPQNTDSFYEIISEVGKLGKPVYYVRGNWDINVPSGVVSENPFIADLESVGPVEMNGVTLVGHAASLEPVKRKIKRPVVLVTHYPPFSILDKGRKIEAAYHGSHTGIPEVNYLVSYYKPSAHIFGHCHALGGLEVKWGGTVFINVARLDRTGRGGRTMGNYAVVVVDRNGAVSVKWRFVNGQWKKCSKCGRTVHLPQDWTLCRRCASHHELNFKRIDRRLEKIKVTIANVFHNSIMLTEEFFIPITTLKDEEAFEDLLGYLILKKLKEVILEDGGKILSLTKDKVIEYYSEDAAGLHAFSEYLFSCNENKVGRRICTLMRAFYLDKRAKILWKIRQESKVFVESEILLVKDTVLRHPDLVENIRESGFELLTYKLEEKGASES